MCLFAVPGAEPPLLVGTVSTYWLIDGVPGGTGGGVVSAKADPTQTSGRTPAISAS
jgi:hypothetical protein